MRASWKLAPRGGTASPIATGPETGPEIGEPAGGAFVAGVAGAVDAATKTAPTVRAIAMRTPIAAPSVLVGLKATRSWRAEREGVAPSLSRDPWAAGIVGGRRRIRFATGRATAADGPQRRAVETQRHLPHGVARSLDVLAALALAGLAWLALAAVLLHAPRGALRDRLSGGRGRPLLGIGIGLTVGIALLVARTDLVPDGLEPSLVPVIFVVTAVSTVLVGWLAWSVSRS
jgi:hypothetical protein